MYLLTLDKDYCIAACLCGQRHTYYFDHGSCESKTGPFNLQSGDWIDYRFDSDFGNEGIVERITFFAADFPDSNNVTVDQLVNKLNATLQHGKAYNDYGTLLVISNNIGPGSCVEVVGTSRDKLLGYDVRHDSFWHHCCNRIQLGFAPPKLPNGEQHKHKDIIIFRKCRACGGQSSTIRLMTPITSDHHESKEKHIKGINTLAIYLKQLGHVDYDMVNEYAQETEKPADYYPEFFQTYHIEIYTFEELSKPQQK